MSVVSVEQMSFEELVQTLAMFEQEHEPSDVDRAIHRAAVERRLLAILSAGNPAAERRAVVRVPGDLSVRLLVGGEELRATVRDLGEGGLGIRSLLAPPEGATVDIEMVPKKPSSLLHPPRAQGVIAWVRPVSDHGYDLGLRFLGHDEAARRRMRRLVVELLRRLPAPLH